MNLLLNRYSLYQFLLLKSIYLCNIFLIGFKFIQAKSIFSKMYPDSEFLPRAPDPEELSLEVDEAAGPPFQSSEEPKEE